MDRRLGILTLVAGLLASAMLPASDNEDAAHVGELLKQLGAESRRERDEAEQKLLDIGPAVLGLLPTESTITEAGIREAVARIRNTAERKAAAAAAEPSRISLEGEHTLAEITAAIARQSGNPIEPAADVALDRLSVHWSRLPFWDCVVDLEQRAGVQVAGDSTSGTLLLSRREAGTAPPSAAVSGPCRIVMLSASTKPSFVEPTQEVVQVRWRLDVEPRLRPLYVMLRDARTMISAVGLDARPLSPEATRELPVDRWTGCEIDSQFSIPKGTRVEAVRFEGQAVLKAAALPLPFVFEKLSSRRTGVQRRGGVSVILRELTQDEAAKTVRATLTVAYDRTGPEFESHRTWIHQNSGWLERAEGAAPMRAARVDLVQIARAGATLIYEFENVEGSLDDLRLVYEAPALVVEIPIEWRGAEVRVRPSSE